MSNKLGKCLPMVVLLTAMYLAVEDAHARSGRSSSRSSSASSSSSATSGKKAKDEDVPAGRNINVRLPSGSSSYSSTGSQGQGVTSLQSTGAAAAVGATAGSAALVKPVESPEEARDRIAKRNAQLLAEQEARERVAREQREANDRILEKAKRDRERQAAEEEQRRAARRQSAIAQVPRSSCVVKPVMTQAEIEACR